MTATILANATLVLPDAVTRGALVLEGSRIARVEPGQGVPAGARDLRGDWLLPGLVELHTDTLERHIEPRPGVDWPHAAAILAHDRELAAHGITTVFDAMRVGSMHGGSGRDGAYARALARELLALVDDGALTISHLLHLRAELCSETLCEELEAFVPGDRVGLVSIMDHTPGARQFRDLAALRRYHRTDSEADEAAFEAHIARLQALGARMRDDHERAAIAAARRLGAVLASHDDTTPAHVAHAAEAGVRLAEFPTTEEAARACRAAGLAVMAGAPNLIRGGSHSGNVAGRALARAGLIDILSSDYVPAALLAGAFTLGDLIGDRAAGIAAVTAAPARVAGLGDRGRLQAGLRADLVRVRVLAGVPVPRATWVAGRRVA